MLVEFFVLA